MKNKNLVFVTQRVEYIKKTGEFRDSLDERLIEWLKANKLLAMPVSNNLLITKTKNTNYKYLKKWLNAFNPKAIVFSGGHDIGKYKKRDLTEFFILEWGIKNKIPLFGICRGMQIIGNYFGSNLIKCKNHVRKRHPVYFNNGSKVNVNSFHAWGLKKCPRNFKVLAKSKDNIIELMKHKFLPIQGCMWHPEREKKFSKEDLLRLKKLV